MNSAGLSETFEMQGIVSNRIQAEVVCRCLNVTDVEIQAAIETCAVETVKEIGRCTGAGQGCNSCHRALREMLANRSSR